MKPTGLGIITWITWLGIALVTGTSMMGFIYSNFETKGHAQELASSLKELSQGQWSSLEKRLDRIESKIDALSEAPPPRNRH